METFEEYLETVDNEEQRLRLTDIFAWIAKEFSQLDRRIAWNQPMFTNNGTFIIGFSKAKNHISIAPEKAGLRQFENEIKLAGYEMTKELFKIKNKQPVDYDILRQIISFNIEDKEGYPHFWRK